jgi:hypothetical protein
LSFCIKLTLIVFFKNCFFSIGTKEKNVFKLKACLGQVRMQGRHPVFKRFLTQNNFLSDAPARLNKTSKAFLESCTIANIMVYELEHSNHYQFAKKEIKEVEAHTQLQLTKRNAL